jgi:hypothetical protein
MEHKKDWGDEAYGSGVVRDREGIGNEGTGIENKRIGMG